jgi:hypothetical protein
MLETSTVPLYRLENSYQAWFCFALSPYMSGIWARHIAATWSQLAGHCKRISKFFCLSLPVLSEAQYLVSRSHNIAMLFLVQLSLSRVLARSQNRSSVGTRLSRMLSCASVCKVLVLYSHCWYEFYDKAPAASGLAYWILWVHLLVLGHVFIM